MFLSLRPLWVALHSTVLACALVTTPAVANPNQRAAKASAASAKTKGYDAEARLIQIYQRIGQAQTREALKLADQLVKDHPNFALAQLVHGDLLNAQTRPLKTMGDMPEATARAAPGVLGELREESLLRLKALRERPPAGMVPSQFVRLPARNKHAIAVDAARARLYVFENTPTGMRLTADYYISVGKLGTEKSIEGDLRTPLGVYFITNTLARKTLKDFYGAGALPINYPNPFDLRRGKTGSGIWLHGTPSNQFSRPPKATDGCVVLSNPDLERILSTVEIRTTPVVIAPSLQWVSPAQSNQAHRAFDDAWNQWRAAKASADLTRTVAFYTSDFNNYGKNLSDWTKVLQTELAQTKGRQVEAKDVSVLSWQDNAQTSTMVVTFSEVRAGSTTGSTKRQYWLRSPSATQNQWKIFFEGVIG
jgi:L,D-transpeptidase YnhG